MRLRDEITNCGLTTIDKGQQDAANGDGVTVLAYLHIPSASIVPFGFRHVMCGEHVTSEWGVRTPSESVPVGERWKNEWHTAPTYAEARAKALAWWQGEVAAYRAKILARQSALVAAGPREE